MADNIDITPGTGRTVATDQIAGVDYPRGKIGWGVDGTYNDVSAANPLPVSDAGGSLTVDGTVAATQSGSWAVTGSGVFNVVPASPAAASYLPVRLTDGTSFYSASGGTGGSGGQQYAEDAAHTSGDLGTLALAVRKDTATQLAGTDGDYSPLVTDASGRLHVNVGNTVAVSGTFWQATQPVSAASLPLPTGASTSARQPALGTAGTASADVLTIQGIASMTAVKVDGSAVTQPVSGTVTANAGTGTFAVSASSLPLPSGAATEATLAGVSTTLTGGTQKSKLVDSGGTNVATVSAGGALKVDGSAATQPVSGTVAATQSGTWNVGTVAAVTAITNALPAGTNTLGNVGMVPTTSGGCSAYHLVSAGSTNAANVKASAGQVYGWAVFNANAANRYLKVYDKASSPTVGTDTPILTVLIPPGGGSNVSFPAGIACASGISIALTTGIADSDTGAVTASDIALNLLYK